MLGRFGLTATAAIVLAGCALVPPGATGTATTAAPTVSPASPTAAATSEPASTSPSPTAATSAPPASAGAVKAKGELFLYDGNLVSDQLRGDCRLVDSRTTITVTDDANDFFASVAVQVVLSAGATVESVDIDLGEDSESISHTVRADAGASKVSREGDDFRVTGKGTMTDDGKVSATGVPFTVDLTCAGFTG